MAYIDFGKTDIVILGRPSVGKSILCHHLVGEAAKFSYNLPSVSTKVETEAVQTGVWTKLIRVIPGQSSRDRAKGLMEAFTEEQVEGKLSGVIYVVDWGVYRN